MTKPMPLAEFARLPPVHTATLVDGLSGAIDAVADRARPSHRFLRYGWYAAALQAYGGHARTVIVERDGAPVMALPLVGVGPAALQLAMIPGSYWPFRGFPIRHDVADGAFDAALTVLARGVVALRIGPVHDDDHAAHRLLAAGRARGWATIDRFIAGTMTLDIAAARAAGPWPRTSTLKKNRFHEKHLASHGTLAWRFVSGEAWDDTSFEALAAIERASWIAARTDGADAKFANPRHATFWRAAAGDPALAAMLSAAVLDVDGRPAAFSFDLDAGALKYAIANSYDPAYAKHSPGKLLYYRNLVRAADQGTAAVDWGCGDSGYKQTLGAVDGPALRDWLLVRPGLPARVARAFAGVWRRSGNRG